MRLAVTRFEREETGDWQNYGELIGRLDLNQGLLVGEWKKNASDAPHPFHFRQTASGKAVVRTAGALVFGRGRTVEYRARIPAYLSPTPLDRVAEEILLARAVDAAVEEAQWPFAGWEDFQEAIESGSPVMNQWEISDQWSTTFRSDTLISLLGVHSFWTGGNHPNSGFSQLILWWDGSRAVAPRLGDFFREDSNWRNVVSRLCVADLERQKASWPSYVEEYPDMLDTFTIEPDGFRFHFAPYEVGCYAEGAYAVTVPFARVADLLRDEGPAAALRTERHPIPD